MMRRAYYLVAISHTLFESIFQFFFNKEVTTSLTCVTQGGLPLSKIANKYHGRRSHHQLMTWIIRSDFLTQLTGDRFKKRVEFVPVNTDLQAAPLHLLKVFHCNCSTASQTLRGSWRWCSSHFTSVRRHCRIDQCVNPRKKSISKVRRGCGSITFDKALN